MCVCVKLYEWVFLVYECVWIWLILQCCEMNATQVSVGIRTWHFHFQSISCHAYAHLEYYAFHRLCRFLSRINKYVYMRMIIRGWQVIWIFFCIFNFSSFRHRFPFSSSFFIWFWIFTILYSQNQIFIRYIIITCLCYGGHSILSGRSMINDHLFFFSIPTMILLYFLKKIKKFFWIKQKKSNCQIFTKWNFLDVKIMGHWKIASDKTHTKKLNVNCRSQKNYRINFVEIMNVQRLLIGITIKHVYI